MVSLRQPNKKWDQTLFDASETAEIMGNSKQIKYEIEDRTG